MFSKRKIAALVAEFLGTGILAFVVLTIGHSQIGIPYFVALAAGLAVLAFGLTLQRDVQLNPAYTLALWTARRMPTIKAVLFIGAQLLGGLAAYMLFKYFSRGKVQQMPTAYDAHILVAEAVGTFVFAFVAAGAGYQRLHQFARNAATAGGYAIGIIVASSASAAFINPSVALANNAWAWTTYVLGPVLGAVIGVNLYGLLFAPKGLNRDLVAAKTGSKSASSSVDVDSEDLRKSATSKSSSVEDHVREDSEAVPANRLDKVNQAERAAKKAKKKSRK